MKRPSYKDIIWAMGQAQLQAEKASKAGEVPVGACILDPDGKIVSTGENRKEELADPTSHAEIEVIKAATQKIEQWRLNGFSIVVTLEPCLMCMGAILHARLSHLYFGAYDKKAGALSLGYNIHDDKRLNHKFSVTGGINHFGTSRQLSQFFKTKRSQYTYKNRP